MKGHHQHSAKRVLPRGALLKGLLWLCCFATLSAHARQPLVYSQSLQGAQRGTVVDILLRGDGLENPRNVVFYQPGIEVVSLKNQEKKPAKAVEVTLRIKEDCVLGEHLFHLHTAKGLSSAHSLFIGTYPTLSEKEPNSSRDSPQEIPLNHTVEGTVTNEDIDFFSIEGKAGEVISLEVEAIRLGNRMFDAYLAVVDSNRFEIAVCDDSPLTLQDPSLSFTVPEDGRYVVELREASYGGDKTAHYRLHIGHFPRPQMAFPPGGKPGETLAIELLDTLGRSMTQDVTLAESEGRMTVWPTTADGVAPSPLLLQVGQMDWVSETEPNQWRDHAQVIEAHPPFAVHGKIGQAGDQDMFIFEALKNQELEIQVYGRRLGSQADLVLRLLDEKGKQVGYNDDLKGLDPVLKYRPKADGKYTLHIYERLGKSGSLHGYRVEVRKPTPSLSMNMKDFRQRTQYRHAVAVPRGGQSSILLQVTRKNAGGELQGFLDGLPESWQVDIPPVPNGEAVLPILVRVPEDAEMQAVMATPRIQGEGKKGQIHGGLEHDIKMVYGNPNNALYHRSRVDTLPVAVVDPLPYRVELLPPSAPVVHGGAGEFVVKLHRKEGFTKKVRVRMLYMPRGISAVPEITIPEKADSTTYRVTVNSKAAVQTFPMSVIAAEDDKAPLDWVASDFCNIEVHKPYVNGSLGMSVVERKGETPVVCTVGVLQSFEGEGTIRLVGLPPGVEAAEQRITKDSTQVVFMVSASESSPTGQHKSLFCDVQIPSAKGRMQHSIAGGGVLRIDPVPKAEIAKVEKKPDVKPAPAKKAPKILSRLEQLRLKKKQQREASSS